VRPWVKTSIYAGFVAGTIDLGAACLINWVAPPPVLRVVASGILGRAAVHGGVGVLALGLVLQWAMSMLIAGIFVLAAEKAPLLKRRWLLAGLAYGVVIFAVMNYVVVPLSQAVIKVHFSPQSFVENLLAMLLFGLIVAYGAANGPSPANRQRSEFPGGYPPRMNRCGRPLWRAR
jgi:uncharacterized membrane protein YagU involved in acid resistance